MGLNFRDSLGSPMGAYAFPEGDFLDMQAQELAPMGLPQGLHPGSMHSAPEAPSRPSRLGPLPRLVSLPRQNSAPQGTQLPAYQSLASVWLASPDKAHELDPHPWPADDI